jgi:hypothetical protein
MSMSSYACYIQVPTFERVLTYVNAGDNDTLRSIGEFRVQTPGIYHFHLQFMSALPAKNRGTELYLVKNQRSVNGAVAAVYPNSVGLTEAILKLKAGDRIYSRLFFGSMFSDFHGLTYFTGSKIAAK